MSGAGMSPRSPTQLIEEIFGLDPRDTSLWLADISRAGGILSAPSTLPPPPDRPPGLKRPPRR